MRFGDYEYLTGEDLGYKPDVIQRAKFVYCPLAEAFNKAFKKDEKIKKPLNTRIIWFITLCKTSSVSSFNETSSIDSKFDTTNKFYKDLLKLIDVKSQNKNTKQKKITLLKNASLLYNKWIDMYKKEYQQVFETNMKTGGKNMIIKI